ncbi:hypothetical protein NP493_204g12009 [Ridgeia piscesae]|uniref:Uncharacterized protein n=1 Tax=Ridgeia piscesae TaxID=27915 RepID=A0AAD9P152_RIDPI|nr:hypothetical protein NP493_204g12009 [Ridgeia piscesae]
MPAALSTERRLWGLTWRSLTKNYSLMPLLVCMVGGTVMGFAALGRLGVKGPDVVFDKRNPQPWHQLAPNTQYKLYTRNLDYSTIKIPNERPQL